MSANRTSANRTGANRASVNTSGAKKSPVPFIIIGVVLVGVIAAVVLMSRQSTSVNSSTTNAGSTTGPNPATSTRGPQPGASNPYTRGPATAKVTLEEFSDFQCPACGNLEPGLRRVLNDYRDRVQFIFRNFPLQMHKYAFLAARAAEAAGQQGKFWEMHDMIYDNQKEWSEAMEPRVQFDAYATRLGLDVQRFKADMDRQDLANRITADLQRGGSLGVKGTPTVYLNGREMVPGKLVTEEDLRREIDAALGSSGK
ncbi:MAG TPA: thioredoxin domain-containing protein [Pyrinomonadaceae bacterium]|nr:thioredoxin domain-containing protein [Pyrinomonadaceae bacterium]